MGEKFIDFVTRQRVTGKKIKGRGGIKSKAAQLYTPLYSDDQRKALINNANKQGIFIKKIYIVKVGIGRLVVNEWWKPLGPDH